jgi:hypothetical protein
MIKNPTHTASQSSVFHRVDRPRFSVAMPHNLPVK